MKPKYSDISINCEFDWQLKTKINSFHQVGEIVSELGGIKSVLEPMITNLTPIFTVVFLIKLMNVIKQVQINEYFYELKNTI